MKKLLLCCSCIAAMTMADAQTPIFDWAVSSSGKGTEYSNAMIADAAGNTYVTGTFDDTTDFDPGGGVQTLIPQGGLDIFLIKFNTAGGLVWAKQIGGKGNEIAYQIAADPAGNIFMTGYFNDTCDFDPGPGILNMVPMNSSSDIFVTKLDVGGNLLWTRSMGGPQSDVAYALTTDPGGNVCLSGNFQNEADFDPGTGVYKLNATGDADVFVCKLNSGGDLIWAKQLATTGESRGISIAADAMGKVSVTGTFEGTVDFDPGAGTYSITAASVNVFILRLDALGDFVWAKSIRANSANAIKVDAAGNLYACGYFFSKVDFDPGPSVFDIMPAGSSDIFILKLNPNGDFIWVKVMGGATDDYGFSMVLDAKANIYTTGSFQNDADFDPGPASYTLNCNDDFFISKLDSAGNFIWAKNAVGLSTGSSIAVNAANDVLSCGYLFATTDFDPGTGVYNLDVSGDGSTTDVFVHKMSQATTETPGVSNNSNVIVSPNPCFGALTIIGRATQYDIEVIDILGSVVKRQKSTGVQTIVDISGQPGGVYFLQITEADSSISRRKIVRQ